MDGFKAEPPASAWDAIQADLQTPSFSNVAEPSGNTVISAIKSISTFGKVLMVVGTIAVGSISYYFLNKEKEVLPIAQSFKQASSDFGLNQKDTDETEKLEGVVKFGEIAKVIKQPLVKIVKPTNPPVLVSETQDIVPLVSEPRVEDLPAKQIVTKDQVKKEIVIPIKDNTPSGNQVNDIVEPIALAKATLDFADLTEQRQPKFYNVISPNGDGKNDTWFVEIEEIAEYHLNIYSFKGELVFESDKVSEHWRGEHSRTGELCAEGKYAFVLNYRYKNETRMNTDQGLIMLFR